MTAGIISAADPNVLGVIPMFGLGDYRYTAAIVSGLDGQEKILVMGRQPLDSKTKSDFEVVPPEEFPKEVVEVAASGFPDVRNASTGENKELVDKYIVPHLWGK